jgi:predicted RNA-binding Zn-ribbon protein involved in translation (DUF1610 family)
MGKGGYNGGSTIIHAWPSKTAKLSETELTNNKNYFCKICQKKYFGDSYFDHLREHSLEGCYSCGEPYNPNELKKKNVYICLKCGKKTLLRIRESKKRIDTSLSNKCIVVRKYNTANKSSEGLEIRSGKISKQHIGSTRANKNNKELPPRTDIVSPSHIKHREKNCKKFGVSLGDILLEAINKKRDNA